MHFNFFFIFFFIFSFTFGQTFHSRNINISSELMIMSSRGSSMGFTGMMMDDNAFWTFSNPAALPRLKENNLSISNTMHRFKEHRSIKIHDYFGDFLADASYVFNDDNYFYNGIAASFNLLDNFTFGISNIPYHDFNYNYIEEVHDASYDLNKDPLVGFHIENFSGLLYNLTYGFGWKLFENISFGFGYNQIHSGNKFLNSVIQLERIKSVQILQESDHLASDVAYSDTVLIDLKASSFISFGIIGEIKNNLIFSFNYRSPMHTMDKNHFKYTIPSKYSIGLLLKPRQEIPVNIVFEYDIQDFSSIDTIFENSVYLNDKKTYHFGIEYLNNETPIRVGMIYKNSPFQRELDESIFTVGFGRKINSLSLDISANYSSIIYSYIDQFVPNGDISNPDEYEKIKETNIGISITLSYKIK